MSLLRSADALLRKLQREADQDKGLSSQQLQQISSSLKNLSQEVRMLDELEREAEDRSRRLVERRHAGQVLASIGATITGSLDALGADLAAPLRGELVRAGVLTAAVDPVVFDRAVALAVRNFSDRFCGALAGQVRRAVAELTESPLPAAMGAPLSAARGTDAVANGVAA
jgi:hypothetical protein